MEKPCVIVTGANGQLGKEIRDLEADFPQFRFVFLGREDLPIHHTTLASNFFEAYHPAFCINCAAYTAVDKAEEDRDTAFQVNAQAVAGLAAVCKTFGTQFIHISTDYVFDGSSPVPYKEEDPTGPINIYGASKLEGEKLCMEENPSAMIIRTSWVYSIHGKNFVKTMMKLMQERTSLTVVNDQIGAPTYAADLANAILQIISGQTFVPGIYHYSNQGRISWFDFASEIKRLLGASCELLPVPSTSFPTPAKRPSFSLLNTEKICTTYGITIPDWKKSLAICMQKM